MKMAGSFAASIAVALFANGASAQAEGHEDMAGAKDHPMVERFPGSVLDDAVNRDFEEFGFPVAEEDGEVKTKQVEGRFTHLTYLLPQTASCTQVTRNYEKAFKAAGLQTHLSRNGGWKLRIEGHTDDVGKAKDNLALSRKRADAVREWLVANAKVAAARLDTKGLGDTKPVAGNESDDGRAKNRRVELVKI